MAPPRTGTRALVRALHHPIRATLKKAIHAAEGPIRLSDLEDAFKLKLAVARYHMQVLAACGLVARSGEDLFERI